MIDIVSLIVGILSLAVSAWALWITYRTLWNVKSVDTAIEDLKDRHLFFSRLDEHYQKLRDLSKKINDLDCATPDQRPLRKYIRECVSECESIQKKPCSGKYLEQLSKTRDLCVKRMGFSGQLNKKKIEELLDQLDSLVDEIDRLRKDKEQVLI
ncbi:MAG TPA: hypothetical protein DEB39_02945 [Planctomycetaceae bacterium]|nr:hypothetical protein [Planctomycetaceae bacterium]